MKAFLSYAFFLSSVSTLVHADVAVMSWGGNYGEAQVTAFNRPFSQKTGIKTTLTVGDQEVTTEIEQSAYAEGARALIHKPNDVNDLVDTVQRLIQDNPATSA